MNKLKAEEQCKKCGGRRWVWNPDNIPNTPASIPCPICAALAIPNTLDDEESLDYFNRYISGDR